MSGILGNELLQGERIYLDAVRKDDLPRYVAWHSDLAFLRRLNAEIAMPLTIEHAEEWFEEQRKARQKNSKFTFAVRRKDNDTAVGLGWFAFLFGWQARHAVTGYAIGEKSLHGQGYDLDTVRVLLRYGFMELNLQRIDTDVVGYHATAIEAYEAAGFTIEVREREAVFRDGNYYDNLILGILRSDWERLEK